MSVPLLNPLRNKKHGYPTLSLAHLTLEHSNKHPAEHGGSNGDDVRRVKEKGLVRGMVILTLEEVLVGIPCIHKKV